MSNNKGKLFALLSIAIPILCITGVFVIFCNLPADANDESDKVDVIDYISWIVFSLLCVGAVLSIIGLFMESKMTKTTESNTLFLIGFFINVILILSMLLYRVH
jgi:uncharacterized Tic20 family protein